MQHVHSMFVFHTNTKVMEARLGLGQHSPALIQFHAYILNMDGLFSEHVDTHNIEKSGLSESAIYMHNMSRNHQRSHIKHGAMMY